MDVIWTAVGQRLRRLWLLALAEAHTIDATPVTTLIWPEDRNPGHGQAKPQRNPLEAAITLIGEPSHAMFTLRRRWLLTYMPALRLPIFDGPFGDGTP